MSNEEKILDALGNIQADIKSMKADIETLKQNAFRRKESSMSKISELEVVERMGKLLTKKEQDALGAAMEEIEKTKVAI